MISMNKEKKHEWIILPTLPSKVCTEEEVIQQQPLQHFSDYLKTIKNNTVDESNIEDDNEPIQVGLISVHNRERSVASMSSESRYSDCDE